MTLVKFFMLIFCSNIMATLNIIGDGIHGSSIHHCALKNQNGKTFCSATIVSKDPVKFATVRHCILESEVIFFKCSNKTETLSGEIDLDNYQFKPINFLNTKSSYKPDNIVFLGVRSYSNPKKAKKIIKKLDPVVIDSSIQLSNFYENNKIKEGVNCYISGASRFIDIKKLDNQQKSYVDLNKVKASGDRAKHSSSMQFNINKSEVRIHDSHIEFPLNNNKHYIDLRYSSHERTVNISSKNKDKKYQKSFSTVKGDSGGAVICEKDGKKFLLAVNSTGDGKRLTSSRVKSCQDFSLKDQELFKDNDIHLIRNEMNNYIPLVSLSTPSSDYIRDNHHQLHRFKPMGSCKEKLMSQYQIDTSRAYIEFINNEAQMIKVKAIGQVVNVSPNSRKLISFNKLDFWSEGTLSLTFFRNGKSEKFKIMNKELNYHSFKFIEKESPIHNASSDFKASNLGVSQELKSRDQYTRSLNDRMREIVPGQCKNLELVTTESRLSPSKKCVCTKSNDGNFKCTVGTENLPPSVANKKHKKTLSN